MKYAALSATAAAACAALALSGCAAKGEKRPDEGFPSISVSPESAAPTPTQSGTGLSVVDASPGGPEDQDPLWQGLKKAAEGKQRAYLSAWIHYDSKLADSGQVTLTPDAAESVSVTVDSKAVEKSDAPFYRILGTFDVEKTADSAFTLKTVNTKEQPELNPKSPSTKARCTASDAGDRLQLAAQNLADDPSKRAEMRLQWGGSPAVWWAIQATAASLRQSNGDAQGDFFTEACEQYMEAG